MTKYARFDHTAASPTLVVGWYDTDVGYGSLPDAADLLELTEQQWHVTREDLSGWSIANGTTLTATPLQPSLPQLAQSALAQRIGFGIAVTSDTAPWINATYALDAVSTGQIFQIGLYAKQFGTFPGGADQQPYPDINGIPHLFPVPVYISFLVAVGSLIAALNTQQGIMAQGGAPAWPAQVAVLP